MTIADTVAGAIADLTALGTDNVTVYVRTYGVDVQVHASNLSDVERLARWQRVVGLLDGAWKFTAMPYRGDNPGGTVMAHATRNGIPWSIWTFVDEPEKALNADVLVGVAS